MESLVPSNRNESWTDEKHVHFLNSMEAWFVRTMLEGNHGRYNLHRNRHLRDSSDSTLDCKHNVQTAKRHASAGCPAIDFLGRRTRRRLKGRPDKRSRRPSSEPHSSQDQVVPQIENRDKDEKDLNKVPVASMAPAN